MLACRSSSSSRLSTAPRPERREGVDHEHAGSVPSSAGCVATRRTADPTLAAGPHRRAGRDRRPRIERRTGALALIGAGPPPPTTGDPTLTIGALALIGASCRDRDRDPTLGSVAIIIPTRVKAERN